LIASIFFVGCTQQNATSIIEGDAAEQAYVAPGEYDEFYTFLSGGFSGQITAYGLPSGRLLKDIIITHRSSPFCWQPNQLSEKPSFSDCTAG